MTAKIKASKTADKAHRDDKEILTRLTRENDASGLPTDQPRGLELQVGTDQPLSILESQAGEGPLVEVRCLDIPHPLYAFDHVTRQPGRTAASCSSSEQCAILVLGQVLKSLVKQKTGKKTAVLESVLKTTTVCPLETISKIGARVKATTWCTPAESPRG